MELEEALRILGAFEREKVEYVLVGSMGMAVLGVIRATRDIDVFVAPDEDNVARLRHEARYRAPAGQDRCVGVAPALRPGGRVMPIRKFRSVEEMTPLPDRRPFDPENLRIAIVWSRTMLALHPVKHVPGVRKFRSYEEMKARDD